MIGSIKSLVLKPLHQEAFFVFLGQFASAIGTIVGVKLLTSLLQPNVYGLVALGMSVVNLFIYTLGSPVGSAAARFYHVAETDNSLCDYESAILHIGKIAGTCLLVAGGISVIAGRMLYGQVALLALLLCVDAVFVGIQTAARNRGTVAFMQSLLNWSRFIFAGILIWLADRETAEWVFAGFCLSAFMVVGLHLLFYRRKIHSVESKEGSRVMPFNRPVFHAYLWPLAVVGLITWGQVFVDRWCIHTFVSMDDVGVYFALYQISYAPVLLFNSCVYYFVSPIFFEKAGDASNEESMRNVYFYNEFFSGITLLLSVLLAGIMWGLHGWVGNLLLGGDYAEYSVLLPWLVLAGGIYATGSQLLLSIQSGLDLKPLLVQNTVSVLVAVACFSFGTMAFGLQGAVFGSLAFAVFYASFAFFFHIRLFKKCRKQDACK